MWSENGGRENCEDHKPRGTLCNEEVDAVPAVKKRVAQGANTFICVLKWNFSMH